MRPPGMNGDHHISILTIILFGYGNLMAEISENFRPADRRGAVASTGISACRGDEANFQLSYSMR